MPSEKYTLEQCSLDPPYSSVYNSVSSAMPVFTKQLAAEANYNTSDCSGGNLCLTVVDITNLFLQTNHILSFLMQPPVPTCVLIRANLKAVQALSIFVAHN